MPLYGISTTAGYFQGYKFKVEIGNIALGFKSISGLNQETEVVEYREGTDYHTVRKLAGLTTFGNVTFEKGLTTGGLELQQWYDDVITLRQGRIGPSNNMTGSGILNYYRKVKIYLYNKTSSSLYPMFLLDAWPCRLEFGDLDATSGEVLITTMELCHNGLEHGDVYQEGSLSGGQGVADPSQPPQWT